MEKGPRAGPCPPGYCFQNYGGVCKKQSQFVFTETTYGDDSEKAVFSFSDMIIPLSLTKVSRGKNAVLADFPKKGEKGTCIFRKLQNNNFRGGKLYCYGRIIYERVVKFTEETKKYY